MRSLHLEINPPVTWRVSLLDELKGLAIILVVLYHAGGVLAWNNLLHFEFGVDIFVIISGVGLALRQNSESAREFFTKRFIRIYPTYWLIFTAFLIGNIELFGQQYASFDVTLHYLGIHAFFGDIHAVSVNDAFWFITMIVFLYGLYWVLRPILHRSDWVLLIGSLVSLGITLAFLYTGQALCFSHFGARLPGFFIGLLLGKLVGTGKLDLPLTGALALSLFLLTYLAYVQHVVFVSVPIALGLMALYSYGWRPSVASFIQKPISASLRFLGNHSLEIFLLHQPLIRQYNLYLQARWIKPSPPSEAFVLFGMIIAIVITILLSVALRGLQKTLLASKKSAA